MNKILGIGNALVDMMIQLDDEDIFRRFDLKKGGMEMIDQKTKQNIHVAVENQMKTLATGGSTSNTIHGLARLGNATGYIGKISHDASGHFFQTDMEKSCVQSHLIFSDDADTGIATTLITRDGERTFATYLGAAATMNPCEIDAAIFDQYNFVHVEGYLVFNQALILHVCQLAKKRGVTVSMDMASYNVVEQNLAFMQNLLENYVDVIFANEDEARSFTGREGEEALEILAAYCPISVLKLGEKGSIAKTKNGITKIPAVKAHCIDSTGAGDIYASGFLHGLLQGYPIAQCGEIAARLAGEVVEVVGAKFSDRQWDKMLVEIANII